MSSLNLDRLQTWIDQGRLDPNQIITLKELCASRCLHGIKDGVKLLARVSRSIHTPLLGSNLVLTMISGQGASPDAD